MHERIPQVVDRARRSRAGVLAQGAHRLWVLHPSWSTAVKGAVAAAIAWFVGHLVPAPFSDYPYYAPLGAVVAATGTLARSARTSLQATAAILLGALIARAVDAVLDPGAAAIALATGIALVVSGWRRLGEMGGWTATSALFVLILGSADPEVFVGAYAGLVVVGATIGVAVNLLFPSLPLTPSEVMLDRLRDTLVDQLEALADGLDRQEPPDEDGWTQRRRAIGPTLAEAETAVERSREAVRANRRVRRYRDWAQAQTRRAEALRTVADVVDDTTRLMADWERSDLPDLALGRRLRPLAAEALHTLADALRAHRLRLEAQDPAEREEAKEALDHLAAAITALRDGVRHAREEDDRDYFVAGALVLELRRARVALAA
ncbi:FUSC family protein [Xylanimonas oleitrophica]|uniref:FUSC family protein n=1 Tax=Xylanimonas oleitrophica TaxID=2607479 RepID=UPI0015D05D51|nr:aromatic acid exporter family protein [Xylanimonas oleitrophica]